MIRERERVSPAASHCDIRKRDKSDGGGKETSEREEKYIYIYIEWKKNIFSITISIMRHHQPGVIIPWTFISRQDNKYPVAQLFLTNLAIVFHPPPEHGLPRVQRFPAVFPSFPALPRFLSFFFFFPFLFFFPFFFTWFRTHTKEATKEEVIRLTKGRHEVMVNLNIFFPFKSISATISFFHFERFYTSYSSNRYNKDRETQSIIFETNNIASKIKKKKKCIK